MLQEYASLRQRHDIHSCDGRPCPYCGAIDLRFVGATYKNDCPQINQKRSHSIVWKCSTCENFAVLTKDNTLRVVKREWLTL
jgi:hypothetical protein